MNAGSLVCEQDWNKLSKTTPPAAPPLRKGKVGRPRRSRDWNELQLGRSPKIKKVNDDQKLIPFDPVLMDEDALRKLPIPRLHLNFHLLAKMDWGQSK